MSRAKVPPRVLLRFDPSERYCTRCRELWRLGSERASFRPGRRKGSGGRWRPRRRNRPSINRQGLATLRVRKGFRNSCRNPASENYFRSFKASCLACRYGSCRRKRITVPHAAHQPARQPSVWFVSSHGVARPELTHNPVGLELRPTPTARRHEQVPPTHRNRPTPRCMPRIGQKERTCFEVLGHTCVMPGGCRSVT